MPSEDLKHAWRGAAGLAAMASCLASVNAYAQAAAEMQAEDAAIQNEGTTGEGSTTAPEETPPAILVTGSRIRGIEPTGSPVIGLGREDLEASSAATTTEFLSELPQVFNLGVTEATFSSANNANANVTLGTGINLRGLGTESTLTLLDGRRLPQSGTQGQFFDPAVIPTSAIERIEVLADGSSGIYGSDAVGGVVNLLLRRNFDGAEFNARAGFSDGSEEYQVGGAIGQDWGSGSAMVAAEYVDRSALLASERSFYTDDLTPFGGPDLRSQFSNPGNIVVDGVSYAIPAGQDGTDLDPGDLTAGTANLQSAYRGAYALPSQERYSFAATFEQDINDWISVHAQGFVGHRDGVQAFGAPTATLTVPSSNPFFVHPTDPDAESVQVQYSFYDDLGNSYRRGKQDVLFVTGGTSLQLGSDWSAEAFFSYGEDRERSGINNVDNAALAAALADTDPATAFNPFGAGANTNPATLASLVGEFRVDTDYRLQEFGVSADGPLLSLPGGEVRAALGATRQEIRFVDINPFPNDRSRGINSMFGELFIPLIGPDNAGSLGQELNFSAAVRYDDYEDIGSTTNPKFGLTWQPVEALTIRGSWGTSFRAPSLADTGNPFNNLSNFVDPTSPSGFRRVLFLRGGNADLQPETATTWSIGADLEPISVPGLRLSATYYNVDYENRIATPGNDPLALVRPELAGLLTLNPSAEAVRAIYEAPGFAGVPEDPSTVLAIVDGRKLNLGTVKTDGLEFIGDYESDAPWGSWRAGFNAAYIRNFERAITPEAPLVDIVNTINNPLQLIARAYVGATVGGLSARVYANHSGGYDNDGVDPVQEVSSHTEFDLALRYTMDAPLSFMRGITFTLDVEDIFDNDPPYVQNGNLAFDPNAHDSLGRTVFVGVRTQF
jgi:iron complex outermembrane receptor protein